MANVSEENDGYCRSEATFKRARKETAAEDGGTLKGLNLDSQKHKRMHAEGSEETVQTRTGLCT